MRFFYSFSFGVNMRSETAYQKYLIEKIERIIPGCFILKNDPGINQGIPDILVLFENRWAMLEVKRSITAPSQSNQEYYVNMFNNMSFAAFIYPENEEEVLHDLQSSLGFDW